MDIQELLTRHGTTYADEAGIALSDTPAPLYQLLVLTTLLSARIRAEIAVHAARELFTSGWRTPARLRESTWQQRVDALGRAGYKRYDESTARYLAHGAELLHERYHDDLRALAEQADHNPAKVRDRLVEFTGIGPAGADIFCREAQAVWPFLQPYFDSKAIAGARAAGLPTEPKDLAAQVPTADTARLAAALVRYDLAS